MNSNHIENYLKRIGFEGEPKVDLTTLSEIQQKHIATIPFENLNPFFGIPVAIDDESIYHKLVEEGRGGYCFEQNLLLKNSLQSIGFKVRGLMGRAGISSHSTGRTHLILLVTLENKDYIVDAGYGGFVPPVPLLLQTNLIQKTPNQDFRLVQFHHEFRLEINMLGSWKRLYDFDLQPQIMKDYEVANWYTSTHPLSLFTQIPVIAISEKGLRHTFTGKSFSTYRIHQNPEKRLLTTLDEIQQVLEEVFKINLSNLKDLSKLMNS